MKLIEKIGLVVVTMAILGFMVLAAYAVGSNVTSDWFNRQPEVAQRAVIPTPATPHVDP